MTTTQTKPRSDNAMLELHKIVPDPRCQPRHVLDPKIIMDYVEDLNNGAEFPPVIVYFDGSTYLLADGSYRYYAHVQAGRKAILAEVRPGGLREARLHAAAANSKNAVRRSNADRRRSVLLV